MLCMTAIDTNILIYCCDQKEPRRQERAFEILAGATDGVLLWQVAVEFVAASRKLASQGFTAAHAWARLHEFMDVLPLVSFWDALIVAACVDCGVQTLYSEDLPAADRGTGIRIVNPFV